MNSPIALLPAPRTQMTPAHAGILAKAIQDWLNKEYRKEHPVTTRIIMATETVTTRTVIAIETTPLAPARATVHTDPADEINGERKKE